MKRKLLSLIICLCLAVSMIPAPVAAAEGRGRNPFNTAEEIVNETVNSLEVQPTECEENIIEPQPEETTTVEEPKKNAEEDSIVEKTMMMNSFAYYGLLGSEKYASNDEELIIAFEELETSGGTIVVTGICNTKHFDNSYNDYLDYIEVGPQITLQINEEYRVTGEFNISAGAILTITGSGTLEANVEVQKGGTLNIESGKIMGSILNVGDGTISITGGTFSQDVSEFCAEGYECLQVAGTDKYQVVPIIEAQIIEANGTVQEKGLLSTMLNKASAGQTVQLLKNCDYSQKGSVYIQNAITLDLNGYTLNTKDYRTDVADTIDSATLEKDKNTGLLTCIGDCTLKPYNIYMPMIDNQAGVNGYRFFNYSVSRFDVAEKPENDFPTAGNTAYTLKYKYALKFNNAKGYDLLAQDNNAGVVLKIGVSWDGEEHLFNLKSDSLNAVQKYAQFKQTDFDGKYSMFVRFWNYNNTLKDKTTGYRLHVLAVNGMLMMKETSEQNYIVKGYTEETES